MKKLSRMNVRMGYPQYNIVLSHLKKKNLLIEELEKRIVETHPNEGNIKTDEALNKGPTFTLFLELVMPFLTS